MDPSFWQELLPVLITAIIAVGGGGIAIWRFLEQQETNRRRRQAERAAEKSNIKREAENDAWQRIKDTMTRQDKTIERLAADLDDCLNKLDKKD